VAVLRREALVAGQELTGPALIPEATATTYLAPGWTCQVDESGNLRLALQEP
jgi:N-methylhydantoinase A